MSQVPTTNSSVNERRTIALFTAKKGSGRLGVVPDTIWDTCQSKRLRHRTIGRMIRIDPRALEEFERHRTVDSRR